MELGWGGWSWVGEEVWGGWSWVGGIAVEIVGKSHCIYSEINDLLHVMATLDF